MTLKEQCRSCAKCKECRRMYGKYMIYRAQGWRDGWKPDDGNEGVRGESFPPHAFSVFCLLLKVVAEHGGACGADFVGAADGAVVGRGVEVVGVGFGLLKDGEEGVGRVVEGFGA